MFLKTKNNLYKMKHLRRFNESEENFSHEEAAKSIIGLLKKEGYIK
jgi:hypothetical protein